MLEKSYKEAGNAARRRHLPFILLDPESDKLAGKQTKINFCGSISHFYRLASAQELTYVPIRRFY